MNVQNYIWKYAFGWVSIEGNNLLIFVKGVIFGMQMTMVDN